MSLLFDRGRRDNIQDVLENGRMRRGGRRAGALTSRESLRLSVAWACRRLRADLVSTMPIDVFRRAGGVQLEASKPPVMIAPGGKRVRWIEWVYSSQMDLDGHGNTFGVIEERDASPFRRPAVIRLVDAATASVREVDGRLKYTLAGKPYDEADVWHEKQYTVPGLPIGLSPIAHAALSMNAGLSALEFANVWFGNNASPAAHLRNTAKKLNRPEAAKVKANFKAQVADGDVFVSGSDWEYKVLTGSASESMFLEQLGASNEDTCRFLGVPGDVVDVHASTGSITYANITQRNLQLLIMHLNPALIRREDAFTYWLLPEPRYAKFNRGALLQMDLKSRYEAHKLGIDARFLGVDEAREHEELPPLTEEQEAQFARLFGNKTGVPVAAPAPAPTGGTS